MVRTQDLLAQVRRRLRDNGESQSVGYIAINNITDRSDKGHFWSDRLVFLVLDIAQHVFFNQAIILKDEVALGGLYSGTSFSGVAQLPADYGMYIGGAVYPPNGYNEKMARIYVGGETELFRYVNHYAIYLVGNTITARWQNSYPANGRMYYWRLPTPITTTGQNLTDFSDYIYDDWIVTQASVLLGMMETQTSREFKNYTLVKQKTILNPKKFVNYIENREQLGQESGKQSANRPEDDGRS
jgi:hypothetical protein